MTRIPDNSTPDRPEGASRAGTTRAGGANPAKAGAEPPGATPVGAADPSSVAFAHMLDVMRQRAALERIGGKDAPAAQADWVGLLLRASALAAGLQQAEGASAASAMANLAAPDNPAGPAAAAAAALRPGESAPSAGSPAPAGLERFRTLEPLFKQAAQETGVPWQIQAAQWALETGWGQHTPRDRTTGRESFNLFGIKGEGPAGSVRSLTFEYIGGRRVEEEASFRAYHSYAESVVEHARLLTTPYYAPALAAGQDLRRWTEMLGPQQLGYATDPDYSRKLWRIITDNGWDRS